MIRISTPSFAILLAGAFALSTAGCGGDSGGARGQSGEVHRPDISDADAQVDPTGPSSPAFAPFEIAIHQSVTVGAFILDLKSARVLPGAGAYEKTTTVQLDFSAHNVSTDLHTPLGELVSDGLLLEVHGKYFYGVADTDPVPGQRDGTGTISWEIREPDFRAENVRNATITLGGAAQNQASVPLANPSAVVSLADIPLDARFLTEDYRGCRFEVVDGRIQFNSRGWNVPAPAGKALLVLDVVLSAGPSLSEFGAYWGNGNVFVERPDGVSVAPGSLAEAIYPGDREELPLTFEISLPVTGTYTLGVTGKNVAPVTREIVVP
jgi:hypothetical protein